MQPKRTRRSSSDYSRQRRAKARLQAQPVVCEGCGIEFHPLPDSKARFHSRPCWYAFNLRDKETAFLRFAPQGLSADVCHEWTGWRDKHGYGWFTAERHNWPAHQYAWERFTQLVRPKGMAICHRCDNPPCVNGAHLFLGTQLDNLKDMFAKGRRRNQYGK